MQTAEQMFTQSMQLLDPFGITDACSQVQKAWLKHPEALQKAVSNLNEDLLTICSQLFEDSSETLREKTVKFNPHDDRFANSLWHTDLFSRFNKDFYLLTAQWLEDLIYNTPGIDEKTKQICAFWTRQWLNACSPSNFFFLNPEARELSFSNNADNLQKGWLQLLKDFSQDDISMVRKEAFHVGENIATTPGEVIFKNEFLELMHYYPTTPQVQSTPLFIVTPWINKYYILDLNPQKSLVKFLVSQGFSVVITSWKNPDASMRETTFTDYCLQGILPAMQLTLDYFSVEKLHAIGYCVGGTALSTLMAYLNQQKQISNPVSSWSLLCTMVDFKQPGDLGMFISENSLKYLENIMAEKGYLDGKSMSSTFRLLRSNSLIWQYVVQHYLLGHEPGEWDVLFWNTDATRLPEAMHSEYLRCFYLENQFAQGLFELNKQQIDPKSITQPLYAVGTEQDHITPWQSTFEISKLINAPTRYALAASGHIMGILSPPCNPPKRHYWAGEAMIDNALAWQDALEKQAGSWWDDWVSWLKQQHPGTQQAMSAEQIKQHSLGSTPGNYVQEI